MTAQKGCLTPEGSPTGDRSIPKICTSGDNRIYHQVAGGTRESHPSVQDLQSTTRLAESWMLQMLDTRMGFPSPSSNVVIDYFSPTCKMCKINNEKAINNVDFDHLLDI